MQEEHIDMVDVHLVERLRQTCFDFLSLHAIIFEARSFGVNTEMLCPSCSAYGPFILLEKPM